MLAAGVPRAYFTLYLATSLPKWRTEEGGWQQPSADQASVLALLEHPVYPYSIAYCISISC